MRHLPQMRLLLAAVLLINVACYEKPDGPVDPSGGLIVSASSASIPADGFSTVRLTARLDERTRSADRSVTFTTNVGTFVGVAAPATTVTVTADASGVAVADLRSSANVETANVVIKAGTTTPLVQVISIPFTPINPADVLRLSTSASTAHADGASIIQLVAEIAPALTGTQRNVTFRATNGKFSNDTREISVPASTNNRAIADLKTEDFVGPVRVTASAAGVTVESTVMFEAALPDFIVMDVSKLAMLPTEEVTVTAALKRSPGTVTSGRIVTFRATDTAGNTVGLFRNVLPSGTNGSATAIFSATGVAPGLVTIRATTPGRQGTASGEITVRVNAPPA